METKKKLEKNVLKRTHFRPINLPRFDVQSAAFSETSRTANTGCTTCCTGVGIKLVKPSDLPKFDIASVPFAGTNATANTGCDTGCC